MSGSAPGEMTLDEVALVGADPIDGLERILEHRFVRPELLSMALRHASYSHESKAGESNERLEFLGDAVLGLVVAHALYESHPQWREGELTRALHAVVEARSLAQLAREIELGPLLALGRTEQSSGGKEKASILADGMEAVIGALYVDGGLEAVRRFVHARFAAALSRDSAPVARDPKTELQEWTMASVGVFPIYRVVADSGVEGDDQRFTVEVSLQGEALAQATNRTKRAAEREAARIALDRRSNVAAPPEPSSESPSPDAPRS